MPSRKTPIVPPDLPSSKLVQQGQNTRKLILDSAEELFAEHGFDGVSIRDITGKAEVRLALAAYHFKSKESLFESVVERRAHLLNERRQSNLQAVRGRPSCTVEDVLEAFIRPYYELRAGSDPAWRHYSLLVAQLAQSHRWLPLIEKYFNETARMYCEALQEMVPDASESAVVQSFVFSAQLMVSALVGLRRVDALSGGRVRAADLEKTYHDLIIFLAGGVHVLMASNAKAPRTRRSR